MFTDKFIGLVASASLALVLGACDSGDDNSSATSVASGTDTNSTEGDSESSDGDSESGSSSSESGSSETNATNDTTETTDGACSADDECTSDSDCDQAAGESCLDCICFGGVNTTGDTATTTATTATTATTGGGSAGYGPCQAGCAAGETPVGVVQDGGCFCSPPCDAAGMCPAAPEGTAMATCALTLLAGQPPSQCGLICTDTGQCPTGAMCEIVQMGAGFCTHPTA